MQEQRQNLNKIRDFIRKPIQIGNVMLENRLALAPLAGTTEVIFRSICSGYGVGLTTTELVSARGICYDLELKRNYRYLEIDPQKEKAVAIQLFGHDPADFKKATQIILEHPILGQCSMLDINMGCPVKKVVKDGAGSALMKNPDLAKRIVDSVAEVSNRFNKPLSIKIRSGWDERSINAPEFAGLMQQAGTDLVTVHARTRKQMYSGQANWEIIKQVADHVTIPVYGNGDLTDLQSIREMYKETGCDGFALGRAAQGRPWLFSELLGGHSPPDNQAFLQVVEQHLNGMIEKIGNESVAIRQMRAQLVAYLKGKRKAALIRKQLMTIETRDELFAILQQVY